MTMDKTHRMLFYMLLCSFFLYPIVCMAGNAEAAGSWQLQIPIAVESDTDAFEFHSADFNGDGCSDLFAIKKKDTGTKRTEVHVLDGKNRFQGFLLQTGTVLGPSDGVFSFAVGDYNRDGALDLYAIKMKDTDSNRTEIHVLDGKTGFRTFLLHAAVPIELSYDIFHFELGDYNADGYPDLFAIKMRKTDSNRTEIHILDGKSNFQKFLLQMPSCLENSYGIFSFALGDYDRDGKIDIYAIKRNHTDSKSTEIHILNGSSNYRNFLLHSRTNLEEAHDNFAFLVNDYNLDGTDDFYAIKIRGTASHRTEVYVLGGVRRKSGPPVLGPLI